MVLVAVVTIFVGGHETFGTAGLAGAITTQTVDLAVFVDLVVLEDGEFDLLPLVLVLRWSNPYSCASWHDRGAAPSGGWWTPSGYCSRRGCGHFPSVCRLKSNTADLAGFPPGPEFWP